MRKTLGTTFWPLNIVLRHVQFLGARSPIKYVIVVVPEMFILSLFSASLISNITKTTTHIPNLKSSLFVCIALIFGPAVETFFCQLVPFEILISFRVNKKIGFLCSWAIFFVVHISNGVGTAFAAGLVGGFFLALTYGLWRRASIICAYGMTFICHVLLNAIVLTSLHFLGT